MQVSQFGAALLAAWEKAIEGRLLVDCGQGEAGRKKAVHLRYRMYMLRSAMKKEHHPLYPSTLRCKLSIRQEGQKHILRGDAVDAELEDVLNKSGVSVPKVPEIED